MDKDLKIIELEKRLVALEISNATIQKDNQEMKYAIRCISDLANANNDSIQKIADTFNEFLDRTIKVNKDNNLN